VAIILPGAEWRPFVGKSSVALVHDIICLHTQVGSQAGSWNYGNIAGNPYAHLYTAGNGHTVQGKDLAYRSAANLNGNPRVIAWETSDLGEGIWPSPWRAVPWTQAQLDEIVRGLAWLCVRFNIPPVLVPDSKPGRRGIAYHRQGVDPYRVAGGELWSHAYAKACPTDPRIGQLVNYVIPRVRAIVAGAPTPGEIDLADYAAQLGRIENMLNVMYQAFDMQGQMPTWKGNLPGRVDTMYEELPKRLTAIEKAVAALGAALPSAPADPSAPVALGGTFTGTVTLTPDAAA
jgi:hypothetical protein